MRAARTIRWDPVGARLRAGVTVPARAFRTDGQARGLRRSPATRAASCLLIPAWVIVSGAVILAVLRGAFYGLVDRGPYDSSWGGPGRAGAWAAHAGVSAAILIGCVALYTGLGGLARALEVSSGRPFWRAVAMSWALAAISVVVLVAWLHQL